MGAQPERGAGGRPELRGPLPGPRARDLVERDQHALSPSFTRSHPLVIDRDEGRWVTDVDGNAFLDLTAGIAVKGGPDLPAADADRGGGGHREILRAVFTNL